MSLWHEVMDDLATLENEKLTLDQQLKRAEIRALLSISQEVSGLRDELRSHEPSA